MNRGYRAATVGGCLWGIVGAGAAFLLALPFYPRGDDTGWAELGWAIFTLIACATVGIAAGAIGILRALRRENAAHAGLTAAVFLPTAALLLFGGPLVLAAPAAARWMALGLGQWWDARPARGQAVSAQMRAAGWPQRVVLWGGLTFLGMTLSVSMSNRVLGDEVGGAAKVWAFCAVVPVGLLPMIWRLRPRWAVAACLVVGLLTGAAMARASTAELQPSPERFAEIARDLETPVGQRVVSRTSAFAMRYPAISGDAARPVEIVESAPLGGEPPGLPPALTPNAHGLLELNASAVHTGASPSGSAAAASWEQALRDDGWVPEPVTTGGAFPSMDWLPPAAIEFLKHGGLLLGRGLWLRAVVVPYGDGAIVVLSTRP